MSQTKEVHKEYMRNRRKGSQEGSQVAQPVVLPGGLTPALLDALTDKSKRHGLELIHQSLKDFNQTDGVRYGVNGPTFADVGEMLEATVS